ncbi:oxidoreductase [Mycolicibacterium aurum]|uniref:Oxidoreductase n=1 Tax=Mycolicibacterium aurum TaxID=1791 RepID=A0A448IK05_MYCAU|nr:flavin reductase family protein [Mycolicibacterium aurum]VEG52627.1 oxidoreductase [Mycolicibacterium aurum]
MTREVTETAISADDLVPSTDDQKLLRRTFGCFPKGVAAVCAHIDNRPVGLTISSFTSVSLQPPLVSICVMRSSRRWTLLRQAERLGLSFLAREHEELCRCLASSDFDVLEGQHVTPEGAVLLPGATAWLDCSLYTELEAGDHTIALLRVHRLGARPAQAPLVFHASKFHQLVAT